MCCLWSRSTWPVWPDLRFWKPRRPPVAGQFKQDNNLTFAMLLDSDKAVSLKYDVIGYPTTFFIEKNGIIRAKKLGAFLSKEELEEELEHIMP